MYHFSTSHHTKLWNSIQMPWLEQRLYWKAYYFLQMCQKRQVMDNCLVIQYTKYKKKKSSAYCYIVGVWVWATVHYIGGHGWSIQRNARVCNYSEAPSGVCGCVLMYVTCIQICIVTQHRPWFLTMCVCVWVVGGYRVSHVWSPPVYMHPEWVLTRTSTHY